MCSGAVVVLLVGWVACSIPTGFDPVTVVVPQGSSVSEITQLLAKARVIGHPVPLEVLLRLSGRDSQVHAGTYRFTTPASLLTIFTRLTTADYGLPQARLTFVEGATTRDMADQIHAALPGISREDFLTEAKPHEGYLFPDTYFFPPSASVESIITTMRDTFETKTASLQADIESSGHSLADVVILASLIEKEARTDESRRIVAGILWNRLERNMPLQVDAVFGYIFDRDTYSPSPADLKVNSPYNTYVHKGLPPGPINNPGLDALSAVLHPTKTPYLYYLTGNDTLMHYATTYAGHQANLKKYLK